MIQAPATTPAPPDLNAWAFATLAAITAFLLVREFRSKDKMSQAIESLNASVAALTLAVESLKNWTFQGFLPRPEAKEHFDRLRDDIEDTASGLESHALHCPARRATDKL